MSLDLYTEKSPEIIIFFSLWKGLLVLLIDIQYWYLSTRIALSQLYFF